MSDKPTNHHNHKINVAILCMDFISIFFKRSFVLFDDDDDCQNEAVIGDQIN